MVNDVLVQMTQSTFEVLTFQVQVYGWLSFFEATAILLLIIYIRREFLRELWRSYPVRIKGVKYSIFRAYHEVGPEERNPFFGFGEFWAFVFSGLFTFLSLSSAYILAYFAAYGEGVLTSNLSESVQVAASNILLWRLGFIQSFLYAIFAISVLVIFRRHIEVLIRILQSKGWVGSYQIPRWIFQGLRYSILIVFTVMSFAAVYHVSMMEISSLSGNTALTTGIAESLPSGSLAAAWCNLATIINPISFGVVIFWIVTVWLLAVGYLLRREFALLGKFLKAIPRVVWNFIIAKGA